MALPDLSMSERDLLRLLSDTKQLTKVRPEQPA